MSFRTSLSTLFLSSTDSQDALVNFYESQVATSHYWAHEVGPMPLWQHVVKNKIFEVPEELQAAPKVRSGSNLTEPRILGQNIPHNNGVVEGDEEDNGNEEDEDDAADSDSDSDMEGDDDDHDSEQDEEGEIVNQPDHQNPRGKKGSSPGGGAVPDKTTPQQKRRMQAGSEGHQAVGRKKSESIGRELKTLNL